MQDIARTHRVRRLRWQARAPDAAQAFALRGLLREQSESVQQAITRELDRLASNGAFLHLPRLVLKLDALALSALDAELPGRVAAALREALAAAQVRPLSPGAAPSPWSLPVPAAEAPHAVLVPEAMADALRQYLATGTLPWALAGMAPEAVQEALAQAAMAALQGSLSGALAWDAWLPAAPLEARIGALLRGLPLLPPEGHRRWLAHVASPPSGIAPALARQWRALIDVELDSGAAAALEALALWLAWPARDDVPLAPQAKAALQQWITGPQRALARLDPALPGALLEALHHQAGAGVEAPRLRPEGVPAVPRKEAAAQASWVLPLAGLVLLHPFLPRFLAGCGVLSEDGRTIAESQLPRACALLHALACGAEAPVIEHQLPLIKLLLGLVPDLPLSAALAPLDAADREEVEALLGAVREHWTALRGTGVEGLRLSFLQRRGLLRRGEGVWQLKLQAEAFDLLLGLLPWGISLVKLPWMAQPLMVEWGAT